MRSLLTYRTAECELPKQQFGFPNPLSFLTNHWTRRSPMEWVRPARLRSLPAIESDRNWQGASGAHS